MASIDLIYAAAGGNTHPSSADWAPSLLAFGAGNNLALWNPEDVSTRGITALLSAHTDTINAVRILDCPTGRYIVTGSADKKIFLWKRTCNGTLFERVQILEDHSASVNVISILSDHGIFASGSADGTVRIWKLVEEQVTLLQTIGLKPRYLPLACALFDLADGGIILAVAGTSTSIQLYFSDSASVNFQLQTSLVGHDGWIRSLDFTWEGADRKGDILLASASQDKFIRLWRISRPKDKTEHNSDNVVDTAKAATAPVKSLSNKAYQIGTAKSLWTITFEALLVGHEDWIYTARWAPQGPSRGQPTLLSASADNSLSMWQVDENSNVWICHTRLGEISSQKGSTTATGSTGGFWIGLWQPDGCGIVSLGRTGSWRKWSYVEVEDSWLQDIGISGHTEEVRSCDWASDGSYLLTTGSDQTTRMLSLWDRNGISSWHELARPQIHGYDLNCIATMTTNQFVSGADEKLLRVFQKPSGVDRLLSKVSGIQSSANGSLPNAASIPVLGLSNKAIAATEENGTENPANGETEATELPEALGVDILDLDKPPFEEHLARHTLWPEHEKLYGHGYEISCVAATHDGSLIATACKASSIDHAVIRLYDCKEWREIKPPLTAHSLTTTSLAFSPNGQFLLSVSRDRGWFVFERDASHAKTYRVLCSNPKGHSRMILDCSWAPSEAGNVFATAGRDKSVKLWRRTDATFELVQSVSAEAAVTAVAFHADLHANAMKLAYGTEDGSISIVDINSTDLMALKTATVSKEIQPSATVNALRWRPDGSHGMNSNEVQLGVVSDDHSLRILSVGVD